MRGLGEDLVTKLVQIIERGSQFPGELGDACRTLLLLQRIEYGEYTGHLVSLSELTEAFLSRRTRTLPHAVKQQGYRQPVRTGLNTRDHRQLDLQIWIGQ